MSIPRIARIHFVYQFIILTLIVFAVSYIEILPDKRFLFLALIPVFSYQLIIIFCCTELLPLPSWLSWTQHEVSNIKSPDDAGQLNASSTEGSKSPKEYVISPITISPIIPRARLYKKNKQSPDSVTSSDANTQTVYRTVSDIFKKAPASSKASARRSESTKSYVLKRSEDRFEDDLEGKENVRPYRARNWRSPREQKNTKSQSSLKSPSPSVEETKKATSPANLETLDESIESDSAVSDLTSDSNTQAVYQTVSDVFRKAPAPTKASARRSESTKSYVFNRFDRSRNWPSHQDQKNAKSQSSSRSPGQAVERTEEVTSPVKLETLDETSEIDSTDLIRSFSFPLCQRNVSIGNESDVDFKKDLNIPIMPAWNAMDYFGPLNANRRRKSVSTEAIDRELKLINSHFETNEKDFTKSMEVAKESLVETTVTKRGLKPSASFNKWKHGVANYFTKTKRANIEAYDAKQEDGNKTPFYKELFLSKDVFSEEPGRKTVSKAKSSPFPKFNNRMKLETHSPSYISYDDHLI